MNGPLLPGTEASGEGPWLGERPLHPSNSSLSLLRLFHQGVLYLHDVDEHAALNLTPDGVALMADFEITQGRLLESLSERLPTEEMGLMDLLIYEETLANHKLH